MTQTEIHVTVIKWTTHRETFTGTADESNAYIDRGIETGNELRDVDCSSSCPCVESGV